MKSGRTAGAAERERPEEGSLAAARDWAQIHGRNPLEWEARFAHDVWYVDHRSLWLDAKILFLTVATVFAARGISEEGEATMSTFTGKPEE